MDLEEKGYKHLSNRIKGFSKLGENIKMSTNILGILISNQMNRRE